MKRNTVVMPDLSWGEYERMAGSIGYSITKTAMARLPSQIAPRLVIDLEALADRLARGDQRRTVVLLPTTNNPTGSRLATSDLARLVEQFPQSLFILDAVYEGLPGDLFSSLGQLRNVHVLGSLSKFFGLPGLRLGFATGSLPAAFSMALGHGAWSLNAGRAALSCAAYYQNIRVGLTAAAANLAGLGLASLDVYASEAPFVLVDAGPAECTESYSELRRDCESAAQVRPKYFVHQQHLWMRFGLGPEAIVAKVAQFLRLWDNGQNTLRTPQRSPENTRAPGASCGQVLPETRRGAQVL
jgi:histidinol-phosphate/aromatic aminotransferase/cobyric acid decarboxylase-like protein